MNIDGSVALVTGANRGLGRVYARELIRRGAAKVYGAARDPRAVTEPGVTPVGLDITNPELVAEAAVRCADVSLLVNNAGVMQASTFIDAPSLDAARLEMETNYFGTLRMCRAFAPVLAANGVSAETPASHMPFSAPLPERKFFSFRATAAKTEGALRLASRWALIRVLASRGGCPARTPRALSRRSGAARLRPRDPRPGAP
jgi:NAD(P)-dependent dehydrogenase (short-subunit alcohol dehydrogenase family)